MRFGICVNLSRSNEVKAAGWDYVEESVQGLFEGLRDDSEWTGAQRAATSALPIPACNLLVPAALKITGPAVDAAALERYMGRVLSRAARIGTTTLVFGSGGARHVPDGFDRSAARRQIEAFLGMAGPIAARHGVIIVIEPLNRRECNIINGVAEAMEYVNAVNHTNIRCLVDSYHHWLEEEPLRDVEAAMGSIRHVHVADKEGRVPPGVSGQADYRPLFRVLKRGGYQGLVSVEAGKFDDIAGLGPIVLATLRSAWDEA